MLTCLVRWLTRKLGSFDPALIAALVLALGFSLYGIRWGRVEGWNRDQTALRELRGVLPLDYQKPPLHTYLNHLLVLAPIDGAERLWKSCGGGNLALNEARLLGSRLLVVILFLGTIVCAYLLSRDAFGLTAARVIAFAFASSAGFIEYDHFLSCDSPLLFFLVLTLLLAFRIASSGKLSSYLLTGFFTGLCTATKYNGLAVGVSLVVAHLWSAERRSFGRLFFDYRLLGGLVMVPIGFLAGNPGALLDHRKFVADFTYNSKVTPHYNGVMSGYGYLQFLGKIPEIVGWPGAIILALAAILSLIIVLVTGNQRSQSALCFTLALSVFGLYFVAIGSFPRMENRFVLPAIPFLIFMAGPFLQAAVARRRWVYFILVPVLLYNCVCSWWVGRRFTRDPRMKAQSWMVRHARPGLILESSAESPSWTKLKGVPGIELPASNPPATIDPSQVVDWRMPYAYGRLQLFRKLFSDDAWLQKHVAEYELEGDESLFTRSQLAARHPQLVAVYSADYQVPSRAIRRYYNGLLAGEFPYEIVFDAATRRPPRWTYPQEIDFLNGRITILKRRPNSQLTEVPASP